MNALVWGLLVASATAWPVSTRYHSTVAKRQDLSVTSADIATFALYAQYAGAAYCNSEVAVGSVITCANNVCPAATAAGATVVANLGINSTALDKDSTDQEGYVGVDATRSLIVVGFRGTSSVRNILTDIDFGLDDCSKYLTPALAAQIGSRCQLHRGFGRGWEAVRNATLAGVAAARAQHPGFAVVVTGHSLGAAVATLAATELRAIGVSCALYTFGSPRVGNAALADFVTAQTSGSVANFRVTHTDDPVPQLPLLLQGYRHTSPEYWLGQGTNGTDGVVAYTPAEVQVCTGSANTSCNQASFPSVNGEAHRVYFRRISSCDDGEGLTFRRDELVV